MALRPKLRQRQQNLSRRLQEPEGAGGLQEPRPKQKPETKPEVQPARAVARPRSACRGEAAEPLHPRPRRVSARPFRCGTGSRLRHIVYIRRFLFDFYLRTA